MKTNKAPFCVNSQFWQGDAFRCLSESGVLVSYGGTSRKPMVVQPGSFIFKKQTIRGFWLLHWYQSARPDEITEMLDHLAPLIAAGAISAPVAMVSTK